VSILPVEKKSIKYLTWKIHARKTVAVARLHRTVSQQ
jgi:hypothetical protein